MTSPFELEDIDLEKIETVELPQHLEPQESKQFLTLIQVGQITRTISVFGREVLITTLTAEDEMNVGLLIKPYLGSTNLTRAEKTAWVAACVRTVDGKNLVQPFETQVSTNDLLTQKFNVVKKYHGLVIDEIYRQFLLFEQEELTPLLSRLGK